MMRAELTDTMNVLILSIILSGWHVKVDDVHDIANVETASRNTGSDHDGSPS